jgi:hypothetical protein
MTYHIYDTVTITDAAAQERMRIDLHGTEWELMSNPKNMHCFENEIGVTVRSLLDGKLSNVRIADISRL